MTEPSTNSRSLPPTAEPAIAPLSYESPGRSIDDPTGPRRWWIYAVVGAYVLLAATILTLPAWASAIAHLHADDLLVCTICAATFGVCGFSLVILPIRQVRHRPISRRSIWYPIAGSGLLAGGLVVGGGVASFEYWNLDQQYLWLVLVAAGFVWAAWALVFALIALQGNVQGVGAYLYRSLIVGSVLELLVAVPMHIIVRRRTECCAGLMTGTAICIGVVVMFLSLGPGVVFLFHIRRKRIAPRQTIS